MHLLKHTLAWLSIVSCSTLALAKTAEQIRNDLQALLSSSSKVVLTGSPDYASSNFTQRWTLYEPALPTYNVAAKPATVQDVQKIVVYASANRVPFMATGGGHGYSSTLSSAKDALDVDLSNFKGVIVDPGANTVTIGGATTYRQIYDPLYNAGKQIPTGGSSSPVMTGVTLGGGIGPLTGVHGLAIDSLLSVEMVTGQGEILTVSATQNPELFWGVRGAGFNFGIVTSATYRIYDTLNGGNVYNADLLYPAEVNGTIFELLRTYQGTQDGKLTISIASSLRNNTPTIGVSVVYFGSQADAEAQIKPFLDLKPTVSSISVVPWNKLVYTANFGADVFASTKGVYADLTGYMLNDLSVGTLVSTYNKLMNFLLDNPAVANSGFWLLEKFSLNKTAAIPDDSTAYPWRKAVAYGFFEFNYAANETATTINKVDTFVKGLQSNLTNGCGNPNGSIYVNYARGTQSKEAMYGATKLPRLLALKSKYDPMNLFNKYNPLVQ